MTVTSLVIAMFYSKFILKLGLELVDNNKLLWMMWEIWIVSIDVACMHTRCKKCKVRTHRPICWCLMLTDKNRRAACRHLVSASFTFQ